MVETYTFVLFLAILHSITMPNSASSINAISNGSLSQNLNLNFTIFVKEFKGVILYCIDSTGNQFGAMVMRGSRDESLIRLNFNKISKDFPMKTFCGCDPCIDRMLTFGTKLNNSIVYATCNSQYSQSFSIDINKPGSGKENTDIKIYPIPVDIKKQRESTYIMMGNIGPYYGDNNVTVTPHKHQMIGCLKTFYNNDVLITFTSTGTKMAASCPRKCDDKVCNSGICRETYDILACDCSSTALNGLYCNKSLDIYKPGADHYYESVQNASVFNFKLSWKTLFEKMYCLVEITNRLNTVVITINKHHLMMNSTIISAVDKDGTNYIKVNITNNNLTITTKNNASTIYVTFDKKMRINVGFTEANYGCEIFEGAYDFYFNSSLKIVQRDVVNTLSSTVTKAHVYTDGQIIINQIHIIGVPVLFGIIIFVIIIFSMYFKSRRQMKIFSNRLTNLATLTNRNHEVVYTEQGTYYQVHDNAYDSIDDTPAAP